MVSEFRVHGPVGLLSECGFRLLRVLGSLLLLCKWFGRRSTSLRGLNRATGYCMLQPILNFHSSSTYPWPISICICIYV